MKKIVYMLLLLSFAFSAKPDVDLQVEEKTYHIGDRIFLEYQIRASDKYLFLLPDPKDFFQDVLLISADKHQRFKRGKQFLKLNAEIVSFDTGFVHIPPMPVITTDSTGMANPDTLFTPEKYIYIYSILDSGSSPIAMNAPLPLALMTWWEFLIALLLLAIAVFLLISGLKYHRNKVEIEEVIWVSPYEKAEHLLNELEKKQYPEHQEWKIFYLELTYIIRDYFENIYYIHLQELTRSELLAVLSEYLKADKMQALEEMFSYADLVKFAKAMATADHCRRHIEILREIISEGKINEAEAMD
ncbi:MAG: hypothetical protein WCT23_01095 [Candidatus Neomarinimicrobiota bacterium]